MPPHIRSGTVSRARKTQPLLLTQPRVDGPAAVPRGTGIWTADGVIPVEFLSVGDRIITRQAGLRRLDHIVSRASVTPLVRLVPHSLGGKVPTRAITLPAHQAIRISAKGSGTRRTPQDLLGTPQAQDLGQRAVTLFHLTLSQPDTLYAEGVQLLAGMGPAPH